MDKIKFQQKSWNLKDVLPSHSGPDFDVELEKLRKDLKRFEHLKAKLSPEISAKNLLGALKLYERIREQNSRFEGYAYMYFSQNTILQEARAFKSRIDELEANVSNKTVFFNLWLTRLDDKTANRLMVNNDKDYVYYMRKLRKLKPHVLDEVVEQAFKTKDTTGRLALIQLYDQITNALEYTIWVDGKTLKDEKGKTRKLAYGEIVRLVFGPDAKRREGAYKAVYKQFVPRKDVLGEIYKALVRDWRNEFINTRHYSSPISVFNLANDVPDEAVDKLLLVCGKNSDVFQEFFSLKARLLRMKRMSRYHIYAPLQKSEKKIEYSDAVDLVLDAYSAFHPKLGELARRVFTQDHVDSEIRKGKMSGAYCMSITPKIIPYVLLNYTGSISHVMAIGHEVGHALHTMLATNHSQLTYHSHTPLAEIASIFGELLLSEKLMEEEKDAQVRQDMLVLILSELYGTIPRQAGFTMFEKDAHSAVDKGATVDKLADLYFSGLRTQFGNAVHVPKEFKWEWLTIPHIYQYPFYCWTYSFGNLVTLGLYNKFKEEGESFKPKYVKLLSYGGSESPEKILNEVGVNIRSEKFWQGGFNIIKEMIDRLRKLQN
ncbi:MAG: M3 family oligoendopeptidase [Candidatus Bathyarchaeota archaeon]|nr:MAG: M3 family oligoendopeptidase [Candidatus Bathyarchaeota archaeon]